MTLPTDPPDAQPGIVQLDATGRRYVPESLSDGVLATYLTRRQIEMLLAFELHLQAQGEPHGPTELLRAAFNRIEADANWPTLPSEAGVMRSPTLVPLCPRPGVLTAYLTAEEFFTLSQAYISQSEGTTPQKAWKMHNQARNYANAAALLAPQQFGHLNEAISPPTEGRA